MRRQRIRPGGPFIKAPILAAGDDLTEKRAPLVMPTPFLRQNGIIDIMPSLLLSTLAAAVVALPVGKAVFERAPPPKFTVQAENRQSQLTTGIPAPSVAIPQGKTLPDFAPPRKVAVQVDHYPNLPVTTFSLPALAPAVVIDLSTVEKRPQIAVEQIQRPLTLVAVAAVPIPPGQQSYESSRPKFAVEVDIYPDTVLRGIPQPYPYFTDHFTAARPKIQIEAEQYPTLIRVTLPDFAPIGLQLQDHETKPHYEVIALATPNLTLSTLIPPAGALPQGVQVSDSAPTIYTRETPQIDDFQNLLGLNPPPPPVPVVPPPPFAQEPAGRHKRLRYYVEIDDQQFQVDSPQEAVLILLQAKDLAPISAERAAKLVLRKQLKRHRRPQINLKPPKIETNAPVTEQLVAIRSDIEAIYHDIAITQELAYLFRKQLQIEQDDDEDVILLLH